MSVWLYYSSILLCDVWTLLYFNVSHLAGRCFLVIRLNWDDAVCFRVAWLTESFFIILTSYLTIHTEFRSQQACCSEAASTSPPSSGTDVVHKVELASKGILTIILCWSVSIHPVFFSLVGHCESVLTGFISLGLFGFLRCYCLFGWFGLVLLLYKLQLRDCRLRHSGQADIAWSWVGSGSEMQCGATNEVYNSDGHFSMVQANENILLCLTHSIAYYWRISFLLFKKVIISTSYLITNDIYRL